MKKFSKMNNNSPNNINTNIRLGKDLFKGN